MRELGHRRFSVLGWSDGANAACLLAAAHPDRVAHLVIWGGNSYITAEDLRKWEATRDISKWSQKMRDAMAPVYGLEELQRMWTRFCDGMQRLHAERAGDVCRRALPAIRCPTLVMHGMKDPMIDGVHPHRFAQEIKNAVLYTFPDGKHNIHLRYSKEFHATVAKFFTAGDNPVAKL
jgi:valacyclovir hydrolase